MIFKEQAESFLAEATEAFQFLEQQYGYRRLDGFIEHPDLPCIQVAIIRYVRSRIGVQIEWNFDKRIISVTFIELLQPDVFPSAFSLFPDAPGSGVAEAVSLNDLADVLGPGIKHDADFLLKDSEEYSCARDNRYDIIKRNTRGVLAGLARATQNYASPILHGDTSIFPDVMNEHDRKHVVGESAKIHERANQWQALVSPHFAYLETEYGFRVTQVDASQWWMTRMIYQTATVGIYVDRSIEFGSVEVWLVRLLDGELPPDGPRNMLLLESAKGLGKKQVTRNLQLLAKAVKDYATDVLGGDFAFQPCRCGSHTGVRQPAHRSRRHRR